MRRDSYQLHIANSSSSTTYVHHHCPIMTRLYTSVANDANVSRDGDGGISRVGMRRVSCGDGSAAVCDDVFCTHDDDDSAQLLHAWAEYRIAQRGIMVCLCPPLFLLGLART